MAASLFSTDRTDLSKARDQQIAGTLQAALDEARQAEASGSRSRSRKGTSSSSPPGRPGETGEHLKEAPNVILQNSLIQVLSQVGHIFSDSFIQGRYQWVHVIVTYRTPQGKVVIPRAAETGKPVVCRRFAPFTLKLARWTTCRCNQPSELPAVDPEAGILLDHRLITNSVNVLADGKTLLFTAEGEYRFLCSAVKTPDGTFETPRNAIISPLVRLPNITSEDFYKEYIP